MAPDLTVRVLAASGVRAWLLALLYFAAVLQACRTRLLPWQMMTS